MRKSMLNKAPLVTASQSGQAISEFIVVMAVLLPLLLAIAAFSNLLSLSTETVEASRLAAWERTVYKQQPGFQTDKIEQRVASTIKDLYLEKAYSDFTAPKLAGGNKFPSLVDFAVNGGQPVTMKIQQLNANLGNMVHQQSRLAQRLGFSAGALASPDVSIALNANYTAFRTFNFKNYRETAYAAATPPPDPIANRKQFYVSGKAALLAGGWMPANSQQLQALTSQAAFDGGGTLNGEKQALRAFEFSNQAFGFLGFQEAKLGLGNAGLSTSASKAETILPKQ